MAPGLSNDRARLPATRGLGMHADSPKKGRRKQKPVKSYAHDRKRQKLENKLDALRQQAVSTSSSSLEAQTPIDSSFRSEFLTGPLDDSDSDHLQGPQDVDDEEGWEDTTDEPLPCCADGALHCDMSDASTMPLKATSDPNLTKRLTPDEAATELYERWKALIASLVPPLLQYMDSKMGKEWVRSPSTLRSNCTRGDSCPKTTHLVTSLLFACKYLPPSAQVRPFDSNHLGFLEYTVQVCPCESICHILVRNGLFPTAPLAPRQAVSVELLDLLLELTERSSDAVTAMSAALNASYRKRGFIFVNAQVSLAALSNGSDSHHRMQGRKVKQPFRRGLGYALQWYDCTLVEVERQKAQAIASKFYELFRVPSGTGKEIPPLPTTPGPSVSAASNLNAASSLQQANECHRILQLRCAACFGGQRFGRSFAR